MKLIGNRFLKDWPQAAALIVAIIFFTAAWHHVVHPSQAEVALMAVGVSSPVARSIVFALGPIEFYLGILLVVGRWRVSGMKLSVIALFAFSTFLWKLQALPDPPACGCLGWGTTLRDTRHEILLGLLRNVVLLFALALALKKSAIQYKINEPQLVSSSVE